MAKANDYLKMLKATKKKSSETACILSDDDSPCTVNEWLSTGCVVLDKILGGGLPLGRVTEIHGAESTGKSLLAAQVASAVQSYGGMVAYADTETAVSKVMMEAVGVDIDQLLYASPDTIEDVWEFFDDAIEAKRKMKDNGVLLLIWDSVAATSSDTEMENDYGKATMGTHARLISQGLRKITRLISKDNIHLLLLNQIRKKIGVMYGDNTATFGGEAIKFHASIRIRLEHASKIKAGEKKHAKVIGTNTRAICIKNKIVAPYQSAMLPIYFGHGVDDALASFYYLKDIGLLSSSGSTWKMKLDGTELKFQRKEWDDLYYDQHYDAISNLILEGSDGIYEDVEE